MNNCISTRRNKSFLFNPRVHYDHPRVHYDGPRVHYDDPRKNDFQNEYVQCILLLSKDCFPTRTRNTDSSSRAFIQVTAVIIAPQLNLNTHTCCRESHHRVGEIEYYLNTNEYCDGIDGIQSHLTHFLLPQASVLMTSCSKDCT